MFTIGFVLGECESTNSVLEHPLKAHRNESVAGYEDLGGLGKGS